MSDQEKKVPGPTTTTLVDDDIVSGRPTEKEVSRRSVMTALGGVLAGSAVAVVLPGCRRRQAVVYTQPAPNAVVYAQPPTQGGVVVVQPQVQQGRYRTNVTDSDGGPYADPAGYGRGQRVQAHTGVTDSDGGAYADPAGSGRGVYGRTSGVTDSDGGAYADPVGNGRGRSRGGNTGLTDSDGGPYADPAGGGRGRWR